MLGSLRLRSTRLGFEGGEMRSNLGRKTQDTHTHSRSQSQSDSDSEFESARMPAEPSAWPALEIQFPLLARRRIAANERSGWLSVCLSVRLLLSLSAGSQAHESSLCAGSARRRIHNGTPLGRKQSPKTHKSSVGAGVFVFAASPNRVMQMNAHLHPRGFHYIAPTCIRALERIQPLEASGSRRAK